MHEHGCGNSRGEDDPSARGVHAAQSSSALKLISPALRLAGSPTVMFTSALAKLSVEHRQRHQLTVSVWEAFRPLAQGKPRLSIAEAARGFAGGCASIGGAQRRVSRPRALPPNSMLMRDHHKPIKDHHKPIKMAAPLVITTPRTQAPGGTCLRPAAHPRVAGAPHHRRRTRAAPRLTHG